MTTVTQADREAAKSLLGRDDAGPSWWSIDSGNADNDPLVQAFAAHREAAFEAGARKMQERAKRIIEKRMDDRFEEYGTREPDTNATYYEGRRGETLEELDEEDEAIRDAIAALDPAQIVGDGK